MNKLNFQNKQTGDTLEAQEWNQVVSKVDELVDSVNNGSSSGGGEVTPTPIDPNGVISVSAKGNVTMNSSKNINLEPAWSNNQANYAGNYGDVALKPGDDIQFFSHHREPKKRDKVVVKNIDNSDNPVKLQVVAGEIDFAVGTKTNPKTATRKKDKTTGADIENQSLFKSDDAKVLDVRILTGNVLQEGTANERDERGYLKLRAQAIDLRCEKHGGIALQPKGYDNDGNMNKIKFEHGGGDGLEFGTFNTEKTSIFTNEYRFKKDGVWKMSTRETEASNKDIIDEKEGSLGTLTPTGAYKYKKNNAANNAAKSASDLKTYEPADDFYDFVDVEDPQTTTKDIIKTSAALNNNFIETSLSSKKNLKIASASTYKIVAYEGTTKGNELVFALDKTQSYTKDQLKLILAGNNKLSDLIDTKLPFLIDGEEGAYRLSGDITPKIAIESEEEVDIDAKYGDVVVTSGDTVKVEAPEIRLNALNPDKTGGVVNFGATQDVIFINSKLTKGLKVEASAVPTTIKQVLQNNTIDTVYWDENYQIFRVPMKEIYADAEHTIKITPFNYSQYKEQPAYFADGTMLPEDYTCFIGNVTEDSGYYVTDIYKLSTKGSAAVLSKNIKGPVGRYSSQIAGVLGNRSPLGTADELMTLEFELPTYTGGANISAVAPEEFVTVSQVQLSDIISMVSTLKTMQTNNVGPWAKSPNLFTGLENGTGWSNVINSSNGRLQVDDTDSTGKGTIISPSTSLQPGTYKIVWQTDDNTQGLGGEATCDIQIIDSVDPSDIFYETGGGGSDSRSEDTFTINKYVRVNVEFTLKNASHLINPRLELLHLS